MIVMRSEHGTTHDQQRRLFCSPADADRHLASISALKAWFGIPDHGPDWALPTSAGPLSVHVANETWNADTRSYTSDGTVDGNVDGSDSEAAVAETGTGEDGFLVEIDGVSAGHVIDPASDPVADTLAPLDGGDEPIVSPDVDDVADAAAPLLDDEPADGA